jgi:PEP-CTERM motif
MMTRRTRTTMMALAMLAIAAGTAQALPIGPSAYLQASDSPFSAIDFSTGYFFLEDFEDHVLNTSGASGLSGGPTSVVFGPTVHDSVDGDDGAIDGSGLLGDSWFNSGASTGFSFSAAVLGSLPTHAGAVWTDGPFRTGVTFNAYGADGTTVVCSASGAIIGDSTFSGTTAEDRFFGCIDPAGISRIEFINSLGGGIEVDHLQYGKADADVTAVPEPATLTLLGIGSAVMSLRNRRKRRV